MDSKLIIRGCRLDVYNIEPIGHRKLFTSSLTALQPKCKNISLSLIQTTQKEF